MCQIIIIDILLFPNHINQLQAIEIEKDYCWEEKLHLSTEWKPFKNHFYGSRWWFKIKLHHRTHSFEVKVFSYCATIQNILHMVTIVFSINLVSSITRIIFIYRKLIKCLFVSFTSYITSKDMKQILPINQTNSSFVSNL